MRGLRKWWWIVPLVLFSMLLLAGGGFVIWAETPPAPMPEALSALQSDLEVEVTTGRWLIFRPLSESADTGLVFYPGGRVDPRSYAPAAHTIAAQGYLVVVVPMPLNLAVFAPGAAAEVIAAFPNVQRWAVGGHSLGGAMAARFAYQHPSAAQGLALWAAYPAASDDLSGRALAVTSIYATLDGLATGEQIAASQPLLPWDTHWVAIEGGNHAQFGWYGPQGGDNPATISREEQQRQIVDATGQLLSGLSER